VEADHDTSDNKVVLSLARGSYRLRRSVASALAVLDPGPRGQQEPGDATYLLLRCRSAREIQDELEHRKIAWRPSSAPEADDAGKPDGEIVPELADVLSQVIFGIMQPAWKHRQEQPTPAPPTASAPGRPPGRRLVQPRAAGEMTTPGTFRPPPAASAMTQAGQ
jgi:hypothetical protein